MKNNEINRKIERHKEKYVHIRRDLLYGLVKGILIALFFVYMAVSVYHVSEGYIEQNIEKNGLGSVRGEWWMVGSAINVSVFLVLAVLVPFYTVWVSREE